MCIYIYSIVFHTLSIRRRQLKAVSRCLSCCRRSKVKLRPLKRSWTATENWATSFRRRSRYKHHVLQNRFHKISKFVHIFFLIIIIVHLPYYCIRDISVSNYTLVFCETIIFVIILAVKWQKKQDCKKKSTLFWFCIGFRNQDSRFDRFQF